jgi:hypothetical protein
VVTEASRFWLKNVGVNTLPQFVEELHCWSQGTSGQFDGVLGTQVAPGVTQRSAGANTTWAGAFPVKTSSTPPLRRVP